MMFDFSSVPYHRCIKKNSVAPLKLTIVVICWSNKKVHRLVFKNTSTFKCEKSSVAQ